MAVYAVTGGGGFIGSNLVEALLKLGAHVRALDDFSSGRRENLLDAPGWAREGGGRYELLESDIRDPSVAKEALRGADYVLHHAAVPSVQRSVEDPLLTNSVNLVGTLQLLLAARDAKLRRFVYASSSSVYGESETLPKVESMPTAPISPYALQKLAGETYCRLFHRLYGVPTIALRYFNVFGARQDPKSEYAAVVPSFVEAVSTGASPVIYGDGEQTRDFTHVSNVVQANLLACEASSEALGAAYNIACGERISLNHLLGVLARLAGTEVHARHAPPRSGDVRHSLADLTLAKARLGYRPSIGLEEGLRQLWEHRSR